MRVMSRIAASPQPGPSGSAHDPGLRGMALPRPGSRPASLLLLVALLAIGSSPTAAAQSQDMQRQAELSCPSVLSLSPEQQAILDTPENPDAPIIVDADEGQLVTEGFSVLRGNVIYTQANRQVSTERLEVNRDSGVVRTDQPVRFLSSDLGFDAEGLEFDTLEERGTLQDADFYLFPRNARGRADTVAILSREQLTLSGIAFTTCPVGNDDWYLHAASLELDQEEGIGVAKHMRLSFMDVPFFYVPWLSFPINDERKSGFLFPEIGNSSTRGTFLRVPYYLNIAPQLDATIAPYFMSKRGTLLDTELRYLSVFGEGKVEYERIEDQVTDTTRYRGAFDHRARFGGGWNAGINYNLISDPSYLEDMSDSGRATEVSYLVQRAYVANAGVDYSVRLSTRQFEKVDPEALDATGPYEEKPSLEAYYAPLAIAGMIEPELLLDATRFEQPFKIDGDRRHLQPALALDLGNSGIIARPKVSLWDTEYDLQATDGSTREIDRSIVVKELDLGVVLEREMARSRQTLEPRLYYLDVPYENQDFIPLFDTREATPTLEQLFRPNRYVGIDRLGDTEQVTAGLTSRFIDASSGHTWLQLDVARAHYYEDRQVTLVFGEPIATSTESDVFAAVHYAPSEALNIRLDASIDPGPDRIGIVTSRFSWVPSARTELHFSYSFRRDRAPVSLPDESFEQASLALLAPLGNRWTFFGKASYSLPEERSIETMAGLEYESCCWAFRTFQRRYIRNRSGEVDSSLWLQLEFKGLANVGRGVSDILGNDFEAYGEEE